jgi:hypothetical protein
MDRYWRAVPVGRKPRLPIAILAVAGRVVVASLLPEIPRVVRSGIGSFIGAERMRRRAAQAERRSLFRSCHGDM